MPGKWSAAACESKWELAQDVCPASGARQPVGASGNLPKMCAYRRRLRRLVRLRRRLLRRRFRLGVGSVVRLAEGGL